MATPYLQRGVLSPLVGDAPALVIPGGARCLRIYTQEVRSIPGGASARPWSGAVGRRICLSPDPRAVARWIPRRTAAVHSHPPSFDSP